MTSITIKKDGNTNTELIIDHNDPIILRTLTDMGIGRNSLRSLTEDQENEISQMIMPIQSYIEESRRRRDAEDLFRYFMGCEQECHEIPLHVHGEKEQGFIHVNFVCVKDLQPNNHVQFRAGKSYDLFNTTDGSVVFREFDEYGELIDTYSERSTYRLENNFYLYNAFNMLEYKSRELKYPNDSSYTVPYVSAIKDTPKIDKITNLSTLYQSPKWIEHFTIGPDGTCDEYLFQ